jgi:hypothetical protein
LNVSKKSTSRPASNSRRSSPKKPASAVTARVGTGERDDFRDHVVQLTSKLTPALLLLFALSFTFFAIQSGDVMMYLALVRDFLLHWEWPASDPYLYSLEGAELHIAHEYLSYFLYYYAYQGLGYFGLTLVKMILFGAVFLLVLRAPPRTNQTSPLWMALWMVAVLASSFRFIERTSILSDLFLVLLVSWLLEERQITNRFVAKLTVLFLVWMQLHPGYPLGLVAIGIWAVWHSWFTPEFKKARLPWLMLPALVLLINPLGLEGAIYPFKFALHEARTLKLYNYEWFPTYHAAFRSTREIIAFWILLAATLFLVWRERAWLSLRGCLALFVAASGVMAIRFVPWSSFALLVIVKPWTELRRPFRLLSPALAIVMAILAIKNVTVGYTSSSGPRIPRTGLDESFFPITTLEFLKANPIPGELYNSHDFGSYLVWRRQTPIFHHGFVTDMEFYENDVVGVTSSQQQFLDLAEKYNWTKLLIDKYGSYPYFYGILSALPDWKIVAEDEASILIYRLPDDPPKP